MYATCPQALARAQLLALTGSAAAWPGFKVDDGQCFFTNPALLSGDKLHLEAFEYAAKTSERSRRLPPTLPSAPSPKTMPTSSSRDKLKMDLVLLSDTDFGYFAKHAMPVELMCASTTRQALPTTAVCSAPRTCRPSRC
ncbi:MAG: hypothetical protein R3E70_15095 [Burkholderiaceae bacterium]